MTSRDNPSHSGRELPEWVLKIDKNVKRGKEMLAVLDFELGSWQQGNADNGEP